MNCAERKPRADDFICDRCGKRCRASWRNDCVVFGCGLVFCDFCIVPHEDGEHVKDRTSHLGMRPQDRRSMTVFGEV